MTRGIIRLYDSSKKMVLHEVLAIRGLMQLLMKRRNTGEAWTREEKDEIKRHLRSLSKAVPILFLFSLPGGSLLLPLLALVLDRRRGQRTGSPAGDTIPRNAEGD